MIGLDMNVVIRYLVQDDKKQSATATRLIEESLSAETPGYIIHITLCEIAWVLQRCYSVGKSQLREIVTGLLTTKQLLVENVKVVWKALRAFDANNADFCDSLARLCACPRNSGFRARRCRSSTWAKESSCCRCTSPVSR